MNTWVITLTAAALSLLSACSTQTTQKQDAGEGAKTLPQQGKQPDNYDASTNPPLTINKDGITLNLVRIMDGGICKNELQGANGSFLVYADPQDLERIKREQPKEIFKDFEAKIQKLSSEALEVAIDQTNLAEDPFSLGEDMMREKLAAQLIKNFRNAASRPLIAFSQETTLTIEVTPFPPSLTFYQNGCDVSHFEP